MKKWKQKNELYWLLAVSVFCFGGFYDWTAALLGAAVSVIAILKITKTGKALVIKEKWIWLVLIQLFCLFVSMLTAVDRGMNFVGIIRVYPVIAWLFLSMQYSAEERKTALDALPHMGCATVAIGLVSLAVPGLSEWFWAAERLGGFFQYSNTCAVFFLLGMLFLKEKNTKSAKIQWSILFWGILLTGSRTVMILLVVVLIAELLDRKVDKSKRLFIAVNVGSAVLAAVLMVIMTGSYQNLARLATVFTTNSTFWGRLLYWKDAIGLIVRTPLGLGWQGYYYIQPAIQTGVYTTMYVHNDLLQAFLDGGWIAGIAFGTLMIWQIKNSSYQLMLSALFLHSMVDINFQYTAIWFVAILLFDFGDEIVPLKKEKRLEYRIYLAIAGIIAAYFVIPFGAEYFDRYDLASYFYPGYTQAKEAVLSGTGNAEEAVRLADDILEQNEYSTIAYDAKALAAYAKGDVEGFAKNKENVLRIARYDISHYRDYAYLLLQMENFAQEQGDEMTAKYCRKKYAEITKLLKNVEEETSTLAWKLRDQPILTLEE